MKIDIINVDYLNPHHAKDMRLLMNTYAIDPMGGGKALSRSVLDNLANELSKLPHAFSVIGYVDDAPAGLVNCFEMFSTFSCKPLVNIHDVVVINDFRGQGIARKMLEKIEKIAVLKGCCKLTLEVLEGNNIAQASYKKFGFSGYQLDPLMGHALFWQKLLDNKT